MTADVPRRPADRYEWEKTVLRARLGGLITGNAKGSRGGVSGSSFKAIALVWSTHANPDGSNIYPGDATVAVEAEVGLKAVKAVKAAMIELGLTERIRAGARKFGRNDVYRLTLPVDMSVIRVLSSDEIRSAAAEAYERQRGPRGGSGGPPTEARGAVGKQGPVDPPQNRQQGPVDPPQETPSSSYGGSGGPTNSAYGGSGGPDVGGPEDRDTNHDQALKDLHTPSEDHSTTGARSAKAKPTTPKPRQPALIPKTTGRPPEALQIIIDSLHNTGHPEATLDDARTIRANIVAQYGSKVSLNYLRGIANNSGYHGYYADARRQRAQHVETQLKHLRDTEPPCEHSTPAGRAPHPTNGQPLCPHCRTGQPAPTDTGPTTHPDVKQALDAYRAATPTKHFDAIRFIRVAEQAHALLLRGATPDQLTALAAQAGTANTDLITAATRGGPAT